MKVAFNCRRRDGPWGGGNRFIASLERALTQRGDTVVYDLVAPDIDVVLIVDPRRRNPQCTFSAAAALDYVRSMRPEAVVVHRVNECDERKGTRTMNLRLRLANYCADHTVFVASWLRDLKVWRGESESTVILGGADETVFRRGSAAKWDGTGPLRLVTHHWGSNWSKGFDVYAAIGRMRDDERWRTRIALTYIGNRPKDADGRNIEWVAPLDGPALAEKLAESHVYVTASINEPSGNHHMEGALLGMPVLFRRSGGLPEYCGEWGVGFDGARDFAAALETAMRNYDALRARMPAYPYTAARMTDQFLALFDSLHARRAELAVQRRPWRDPAAMLLGKLPW